MSVEGVEELSIMAIGALVIDTEAVRNNTGIDVTRSSL
jgi:hypothetical protein